MALVESQPARSWRGTEIAHVCGLRLIDVLVSLPILTGSGQLERVAPGTYRLNA